MNTAEHNSDNVIQSPNTPSSGEVRHQHQGDELFPLNQLSRKELKKEVVRVLEYLAVADLRVIFGVRMENIAQSGHGFRRPNTSARNILSRNGQNMPGYDEPTISI